MTWPFGEDRVTWPFGEDRMTRPFGEDRVTRFLLQDRIASPPRPRRDNSATEQEPAALRRME